MGGDKTENGVHFFSLNLTACFVVYVAKQEKPQSLLLLSCIVPHNLHFTYVRKESLAIGVAGDLCSFLFLVVVVVYLDWLFFSAVRSGDNGREDDIPSTVHIVHTVHLESRLIKIFFACDPVIIFH